MKTLPGMISSTASFKPILIQNSRSVHVVSMKRKTFPKLRSVLFSAKTIDTKTGEIRPTQMLFIARKKDTDVTPPSYKPSSKNDFIKVRSGSPWYKFAAAYPNNDVGAHFGPVVPFTRKGTGHPVNPNRVPHLDKHLISLARHLKRNGHID